MLIRLYYFASSLRN